MEPVRRGALPDGLYGAELERRIDEAAVFVRERLATEPSLGTPTLGFVLGSGLGGVVELLEPEPRVRIPYRDIPNVPGSEVEGHAGEVVIGRAADASVLVLSGRAHPYEGWSQRQATLLLRAVLTLGIETVVLTNASGGVNPEYDPGDVMVIGDTINLSGENPLLGTLGADAVGMSTVHELLVARHIDRKSVV